MNGLRKVKKESTVGVLIKRNIKLFFKDKGLFFTALITPLILLLLYVTFLGKVYKSSFSPPLPTGRELNGLVGSQLLSSLLAVSPITVAFCSNMLSVQDKIHGANKDFSVTPVKGTTLAFAYFIASFLSTLLICTIAFVAGGIYLVCVGWYLSFGDVLLVYLDVILLSLFGTALSSLINLFLTSQGQISAVGSVVSSCYGFICGAYMPMSNFASGLQKVLSFLPGTYGTVLLRNQTMRGVFKKFSSLGTPDEVIEEMRKLVDCKAFFFGHEVQTWVMYLVLIGCTALVLAVYCFLTVKRTKKSA